MRHAVSNALHSSKKTRETLAPDSNGWKMSSKVWQKSSYSRVNCHWSPCSYFPDIEGWPLISTTSNCLVHWRSSIRSTPRYRYQQGFRSGTQMGWVIWENVQITAPNTTCQLALGRFSQVEPVVPIPKSSANTHNPCNYRPIFSCFSHWQGIGKTLLCSVVLAHLTETEMSRIMHFPSAFRYAPKCNGYRIVQANVNM